MQEPSIKLFLLFLLWQFAATSLAQSKLVYGAGVLIGIQNQAFTKHPSAYPNFGIGFSIRRKQVQTDFSFSQNLGGFGEPRSLEFLQYVLTPIEAYSKAKLITAGFSFLPLENRSNFVFSLGFYNQYRVALSQRKNFNSGEIVIEEIPAAMTWGNYITFGYKTGNLIYGIRFLNQMGKNAQFLSLTFLSMTYHFEFNKNNQSIDPASSDPSLFVNEYSRFALILGGKYSLPVSKDYNGAASRIIVGIALGLNSKNELSFEFDSPIRALGQDASANFRSNNKIFDMTELSILYNRKLAYIGDNGQLWLGCGFTNNATGYGRNKIQSIGMTPEIKLRSKAFDSGLRLNLPFFKLPPSIALFWKLNLTLAKKSGD